ncbi:acetolactate synthase small subunit [Buchnera aphidicola (Ceratovacuna keduensis)]|uniref:acetolactate synthase small subunit n=1 Tax=Buchnera aphidicola TaxID=9 RepID=UPI0031B8AD68
MKKILYILLENKSGVLSRVIGLFSQRGYNIKKIIAKPLKNNKKISKILIEIYKDININNKIKKQILKLINVLKVKIINK